MNLIDSKYDVRYESRRECRQRIFNSDKVYVFYLTCPAYKKIAIFRDYNPSKDDFNMIFGCGNRFRDGSIYIPILDHSPDFRSDGISHHEYYDVFIFELTDLEVERQVYMELI